MRNKATRSITGRDTECNTECNTVTYAGYVQCLYLSDMRGFHDDSIHRFNMEMIQQQ